MQMKKLIILIVLFPLILFAEGKNLNLTDTYCVSGAISSLQYDSDGGMKFWIDNIDYHTARTYLEPVLFEAFLNSNNVEIHALSCADRSEIYFIKIYKRF